MTHDELVIRAIRWLKGSQRCNLVISESYCWGITETPDALGFRSDTSILVECKTSRSDFLRDRKKHFRRVPSRGLGIYRYFLTPKGLLSADELPEKWGLLEVRGKIIKKVKGAMYFDREVVAIQERPLLISAAIYGKAVHIAKNRHGIIWEHLRYSINNGN